MGNSYRILFITHYSDLYGANRSLLDLIDALLPQTEKILVLAPTHGPLEKELNQRKVKFKVVHFYPLAGYRWPSGSLLGALYWDLVFFFRGLRYLAHNYFFYRKVLKLLAVENINIVYLNSSMVLTGFNFSAKGKVAQIVHIRELLWEQFSIKPYFGFSFLIREIGKSDFIVFISNFLANSFSKHVSTYHSKVVYNRVTVPRMGGASPTPSPKQMFVFGVFGVVGGKKNQSVAIEAIALLNKRATVRVHLMIFGGGDIESLQALSRNLDVEELVTFRGFVTEIEQCYGEVDACLVCSEYEAFGRVVIEAMLYGKPIIGNNSGAIPELLRNGQYGLLYDGSANELADRMEEISGDAALRSRFSANAKEYAERYFSGSRIIDEIIPLFDKSLNMR